jgi:hypothetical protein
MKLSSPVALLVERLQQVHQTAQKHEAKLRNSEAATRAVLIDPILEAMGWDTSNPDMIELEKLYGDTRLDYGLLDPSGKVKVIVEAKSLGVNLNDPRITAKLFTYGFTYGIQNIMLTDGIVWQHYLQVAPGNIAPECVDISSDPVVVCADFLISKIDAARYWFSAPITPPPASTPAPLPPPQPSTRPATASDTIKPAVTSTGFVALNTLSTSAHKNQRPKSMRLPDGSVITISYWRDILVECVKFVLAKNTAIPIPLVDKSGKKVMLLSAIRPTEGLASIEVDYNGRTIYLYINYDADNCVSNANYILSYLPKGNWQAVEIGF